MIRKATAVWHGTGRAGDGKLFSESGVLDQTPYSFKTRFENEKGTNPEELVAAARAGCFTMALTLRGRVPNLDDAIFARLAEEAEKSCPVSKVLNATITLDAKLIQ